MTALASLMCARAALADPIATGAPGLSPAPATTPGSESTIAPGEPAALTGPAVGQAAPPFSLRTVDGRTVSLDTFRGKTLIVNVWATWCPPCRMEMPQLISAYPAQHHANVEFLGVDTTEAAPIVRAYVSAKSVPYPQAIDADRVFAKAYDVQYFPTTYVVDPQGILRARYIDELGSQQLALLIAGGKDGRNVVIPSALQTKIDGILGDTSIVFDGDAPAVAANAKKAYDAIASAEKATDDSDPAHGQTVDLLRTRAEEETLRGRAIAALEKSSASDANKTLLGLLRGDAATNREQWSDALAAYQSVLQVDAKNQDALAGIAEAAARLDRDDVAIDADLKLSAMQPNAVEPLVDLGLALAKAGRWSDAYATFQTATAIGSAKLKSDPKTPKTRRTLAWAYLYEGRTHAKGGDAAGARADFRESMTLAIGLPSNDIRHDMYLEEDQEALVALDLGNAHNETGLTLAPWTGPTLPGSVPNTIKYRLTVAGPAGRTIALHAVDVPRGWVASFCTDKVCAPFRVSVDIPPSGVKIVEFQLVPPNAKSHHATVHVVATDGGKTSRAST